MDGVLKGSTDVTRYVNLVLAATGAPATGLTITGLDLQYTRNRTAPATKVDAVALAATDTAHTDNSMIEVDATNSPGLYRVDWPDAAFATGADKVLLVVNGATILPAVEEVPLVNINSQDGVRAGLTALPNAAANAAGGLPISDAGSLNLDALLGKLADGGLTAATFNADTNTYVAKPSFLVNAAGSVDEHGCAWVKNGVDLTAGVTVPKITVYLRADASVLINDQAMTAIAATPGFKYQALTTERASLAGILVKFTATIDGATRTSWWWAGRDR